MVECDLIMNPSLVGLHTPVLPASAAPPGFSQKRLDVGQGRELAAGDLGGPGGDSMGQSDHLHPSHDHHSFYGLDSNHPQILGLWHWVSQVSLFSDVVLIRNMMINQWILAYFGQFSRETMWLKHLVSVLLGLSLGCDGLW